MTDWTRDDLIDGLENVIRDTHDIDVRDFHYARNVVEWLEANPEALAVLAPKVRDAALVEAAKAAQSVGRPVGASDGSTYIPGTSADAAAAIRALRDTPPPAAPVAGEGKP